MPAYDDLDAFQQLPRASGLELSPDGTRLVTTVSAPDGKGVRFVSALWEVDPSGTTPARRLTRSSKGESGPVFAADGTLLFTSARPGVEDEDEDEDSPAALWALPAAGEARVVGSRPGGVGGVRVAGSTVLVLSDTLPASTEDDEQRRAARKDAKVTAVLHAGYPVRYWDHDLGVGQDRLLVGDLTADAVVWRDLTPEPGRALHEAATDLSADGGTAVTTWAVAERRGASRTTLVALDTTTGQRRTLLDDHAADVGDPRVSPDGRWVAALREALSTPDEPVDSRLVVLALDGTGSLRGDGTGSLRDDGTGSLRDDGTGSLRGDGTGSLRDVAPGWDLWVAEHRWAPDGNALLVTADEQGRRPVFRVDLTTGAVVRLTGDAGHYTDLCVSPDGTTVYALRDAVDAPPAPVRLSAVEPEQEPVLLQGPPTGPTPPGTLTDVTTTAADGTPLRSWLVLPAGEGPHPLVLWVHGGPLSSWNGWSWRWCPWLLAAQGYAVLLPDPALSTGYGLDMVRRGWGDWGGAPYTDLMTMTDAALEHPAVDATRTAVMGGSFGGYMANWIAGHTGRFAAVVTHASLWDLEQFGPTTDAAYYWAREMTREMGIVNSPSRFADAITSPVLVVHGDKDYRVPVGEGLRLWWDLCSRAPDPETMPHRFLYFPDENHWVLTPGHAKLWYETVLAFLDHHVLGKPERVPELLR